MDNIDIPGIKKWATKVGLGHVINRSWTEY